MLHKLALNKEKRIDDTTSHIDLGAMCSTPPKKASKPVKAEVIKIQRSQNYEAHDLATAAFKKNSSSSYINTSCLQSPHKNTCMCTFGMLQKN
jgi:hypothetical protein